VSATKYERHCSIASAGSELLFIQYRFWLNNIIANAILARQGRANRDHTDGCSLLLQR
jgi:hypothetical protein